MIDIEKPLIELVKILRESGFNTTCSCGHLPSPYVQMEWYDDIETTKLYNLLVTNNYFNFIITATWSYKDNKRFIEVTFYPKQPLANMGDIKLSVGEA